MSSGADAPVETRQINPSALQIWSEMRLNPQGRTRDYILRPIAATRQRLYAGRVEDGRGNLGHSASPRFPSPLIKPDVRISRIRLSDWLHLVAVGGGPMCIRRSRSTPSFPNTTSSENRRVPREGTL
jgi:hypothetical protein